MAIKFNVLEISKPGTTAAPKKCYPGKHVKAVVDDLTFEKTR